LFWVKKMARVCGLGLEFVTSRPGAPALVAHRVVEKQRESDPQTVESIVDLNLDKVHQVISNTLHLLAGKQVEIHDQDKTDAELQSVKRWREFAYLLQYIKTLGESMRDLNHCLALSLLVFGQRGYHLCISIIAAGAGVHPRHAAQGGGRDHPQVPAA
jgi:hypothetical protein